MSAAELNKPSDGVTEIDHVVVVVHGIRDRAPWVQMIDKTIGGNGIKVVGVRYGRFSALKFLAPIDFSSYPISLVDRTFRQVRKQHPNAKISVIAHSFGTHLVARLLQRDDTLKLWRVIVCGSVLEQDFNWGRIEHQIVGMDSTPGQMYKVVNDCGNADIWPVLGASAGWRFGNAGTDAFGSTYVYDRFHQGGHSLFLEPGFVCRFWEPFIRNGVIVPGEAISGEKIPWYIRGIAAFPLRYLQLLFPIIVAILIWLGANFLLPQPRVVGKTFDDFAVELDRLSKKRDPEPTKEEIEEFKKLYEFKRTGSVINATNESWNATVLKLNKSDLSYTIWTKYIDPSQLTSLPVIIVTCSNEDEYDFNLKPGDRLEFEGTIGKIDPSGSVEIGGSRVMRD